MSFYVNTYSDAAIITTIRIQSFANNFHEILNNDHPRRRVQRLQAAMAAVEKAMKNAQTELEAFQSANNPLASVLGGAEKAVEGGMAKAGEYMKKLKDEMTTAKTALDDGLKFYTKMITPWLSNLKLR